jgi:hypothetical protein
MDGVKSKEINIQTKTDHNWQGSNGLKLDQP